jgi:23S rRNA (uracil1939-C5)-methyltransferase
MQGSTRVLVPIDTCPVLESSLSDASLIAAKFGPVLGACDVSLTAAANGLDVLVKAERQAAVRRVAALVQIYEEHRLCRLTVNAEIVATRQEPVVALEGATAFLPPGAFLQATRLGEEELARCVMQSIGKARRVADLFCGVGTFALRLAREASVYAADSDRPSIACLQKSARHTQNLKHVQVEARNLFTSPLVPAELKEFDVVVLDPPRAGAHAQVRNLARSDVVKVVYVSCDADSFSADARILADAGFEMGDVTLIDQFRWTQHVELFTVFRRKRVRS